MAGMSDVGEKALLNYLFRDTAIGLHATNWYVALFTTNPTDSTTGTEVTGGSYARTAVVRTGAGFDAASGTLGTTQNTSAITFPTATGSWGTITGVGLCLSLAGSLSTDLIYWAAVTTSKVVGTGDVAGFAASTLVITQD